MTFQPGDRVYVDYRIELEPGTVISGPDPEGYYLVDQDFMQGRSRVHGDWMASHD